MGGKTRKKRIGKGERGKNEAKRQGGEDQKEKQTEKGLVSVHALVINSSMLL